MSVGAGEAEQVRILEAALFAAEAPCGREVLARYLPAGADLDARLADLAALYAGRGVVLRQIGAGWAFRTAPDLADALAVTRVQTRKLSRAAVETLAVVAYHQPVTRAEIEEIRGVGLNKGTLDTLLEAGWVRPRGRRDSPGRPATWGTSDGFLDHFGLGAISDLPNLEELKAAGLLDSQPALAALSARGDLGDPRESDPESEPDSEAAPLDPDFGTDLASGAGETE